MSAEKQKEIVSQTQEELENTITGLQGEETKPELPSEEEVKEPNPFDDLMVKKGLDPNSVDDRAKFADIYANMERKASQNGEKFKKIKEGLGQGYEIDEEGNVVRTTPEPTPQPTPQPTQQPSPQSTDDPLDSFRDVYYQDPLKATIDIIGTMLGQNLRPLYEDKIDREIEKQKKLVAKSHKEDFEEMEAEVDKVVNAVPIPQRLTPEGKIKPSLVEDAYYFLKGKKAEVNARQSVEAERLRTQQAEAEKTKATLETGSKPTGTPPKDINKMTSEELGEFLKTTPIYGK